MDGVLRTGSQDPLHAGRLRRTRSRRSASACPIPTPVDELGPGEVGYLIAGIKDVGPGPLGRDGHRRRPPRPRAPGRATAIPSRWCSAGCIPIDGDELTDLRDALEKLRLNDSSFTFEPESSGALGFGFRCGFLGLLHMEIVRERLEREFDLSLIATAPSVAYVAHLTDGTEAALRQPERDARRRAGSTTSTSPCSGPPSSCRPSTSARSWSCARRAAASSTTWSTSRPERVELVYRIPLAEVVVDFFDQLKSRTKGYASLDYEPDGYQTANLVKVDLLINHVPVDAFSTIVHRSQADVYGRRMTEKLRELIPRQLFDVPIQAAIGGRVIARETVKAKRKDVLAKCYGGDITRKRKLLEKQKEGKKKMKSIGRVEVPQEAFVSALRLED